MEEANEMRRFWCNGYGDCDVVDKSVKIHHKCRAVIIMSTKRLERHQCSTHERDGGMRENKGTIE